eukprot:scaffold263203_cov34-Prasinocladus_malaysianus.AAC.1
MTNDLLIDYAQGFWPRIRGMFSMICRAKDELRLVRIFASPICSHVMNNDSRCLDERVRRIDPTSKTVTKLLTTDLSMHAPAQHRRSRGNNVGRVTFCCLHAVL